MDFDTIRLITETFLSRNFANVRSISITRTTTDFWYGAWVFQVEGLASVGMGRARTTPAGIPFQITISKDSRVVAAQGLPWQQHDRGRKLLRPVRSTPKRRSRSTRR